MWCFNSRTLGRVRLSSIASKGLILLFQFTHPGKGATLYEAAYVGDKNEFQFTHPGKGATVARQTLTEITRVSIHAPWEGCDLLSPFGCSSLCCVSIHAPWEGCDILRGDLQGLKLLVSIHAPWEGCDSVVQRCVL